MISVVIACFNEELVIEKLASRLKSVFANQTRQVELIFVDDGSSDRTLELISQIASSEKIAVVPVSFSRNFGHSAAVMAGLHASLGDVVCLIDADLQDPPELLLPMIDKLNEGYDVVYGKRRKRKDETAFKKLSAWLFYRLLRFMTSVDIPADTGDFRVMTREVTDVLKEQINEQEPFLRGLVAWVGFRQFAFAYDREARADGETKYTFKKMLKFAVTGILGFSNAPLYVGVYFAFASFALALLSVIYLVYLKFNAFTVPGWVSLMVVLALYGAFQSLFFGINGAYLARLNTQVTNRPLYIVRKKKT
jgi:glycosyltransferase involved in cell wall biosynthesis